MCVMTLACDNMLKSAAQKLARWAFADSPVGVHTQSTQLLAAVDMWAWERQTADREIISTGAAALWELSSAAVMLLWDHGQGPLQETFPREN